MIKELSCPKNLPEKRDRGIEAAFYFFALSILYYISSLEFVGRWDNGAEMILFFFEYILKQARKRKSISDLFFQIDQQQ